MLTRVLALDPMRADIWVRCDSARLSLRRVDEAIADYAQASTLDPVNPFFALQRSKALMFSAPRLDDAERELPSATERAYMIIRRNLAYSIVTIRSTRSEAPMDTVLPVIR